MTRHFRVQVRPDEHWSDHERRILDAQARKLRALNMRRFHNWLQAPNRLGTDVTPPDQNPSQGSR